MKFELLKERDYPPDHKVVVKKIKVFREEFEKVPFAERRLYVEKKMSDAGFDLSKRISKYEDLEKSIVVYEQKKYVIPKRKKI